MQQKLARFDRPKREAADRVASGLERMCRDEAKTLKPKAAALGRIECRFGPELKARIVDQKVVFTTDENAPNQDDFIREFLRNQ